MKKLVFSFLALVLGGAASAQAESLIQPSPVDPNSIKKYEFKGASIQVSSDVPERFTGLFDLPPERPHGGADFINYEKYARRAELRPDGTGYWQNYGMDGSKIGFEWGIVVENDHLMVGQYTYKKGYDDVTLPRVHTLIFKYEGGKGYGHRYFYETDGRVAILPIPYHWPMFKQ